MSSILADLSGVSDALVRVVEQACQGVVAVKAAPYRVVSGVVVHENLIAVSDHTLRRQDHVPIHTRDGTEHAASILGRDPSLDLAILKIDGPKLKRLEAVNPKALNAGAFALVVGLTIDAGPSASLGILGAVANGRRTWRGGSLDQFLRLDVNLYPSQSGAAVVDASGSLIGMATGALLRHSAIAVPLATIERVTTELLKEGRIRHGYLGVGLQPVGVPSSMREKVHSSAVTGLILLSVEPESPAGKAGLQVGDILISLDGKPVSDIEDLQATLRGDIVGRNARAVIFRGGEPVEIDLNIAERPHREPVK